jgi:predicted GIY-YIG superfamily endonuclease
LKYVEYFDTQKSAMQRELEIKQWKSKIKIKKLVAGSLIE